MSASEPFERFTGGGGSEQLNSYTTQDEVVVARGDDPEDFMFTFTVEINDSEITYGARTEGVIGVSASDLLGLGDGTTSNVLVTPELNNFSDFTNEIRGQTGDLGLDIRNRITDAISERSPAINFSAQPLTEIVRQRTIPMATKAAIREDAGPFDLDIASRGQDPFENERTIPFRRVKVPNVKPVIDALDELEPIEIEARFKTNSVLANSIANILGQTPVAEVSIPPEAFIDVVDVDLNLEGLINCIEAVNGGQSFREDLNDVQGRIQSLTTQTGDINSRIQDLLQRERDNIIEDAVQNIRNNLEERAREGGDIGSTVTEGLPGRDEVRETVTGIQGEIQTAIEQEIPEELLQGKQISLGGGESISFSGELNPGDVIDRELFVRGVVCEANEVVNVDEDQIIDLDLPGDPQLAERIKEGIIDVFDRTLGEVEVLSDEIESLEETAKRLFDAGTECLEIFLDRIAELRGCSNGELATPENRAPTLADTMLAILGEVASVAPTVDRPEVPTIEQELPDLSCSDVSNSLRNRVDAIEENAQELDNMSPFEFDFRRVESLISDIQEVRREIKSNVESRNPCKSKLISRIRNSRTLISDIRDVEFEDLPCVSRFPEVEDRVNQFESLAREPSQTLRDLGEQNIDIEDIRSDLESSELDLEDIFAEAGEREIGIRTGSVVEFVEENAEGECVQFFLNRLQEAEREIEQEAQSLRIENELFNAASERRDEIIQQIKNETSDPEQFRTSLEEFIERSQEFQQ